MVRSDFIPAVADRALSKQNKYLPGSHILVFSPVQTLVRELETLLVLVLRDLINELAKQWTSLLMAKSTPSF